MRSAASGRTIPSCASALGWTLPRGMLAVTALHGTAGLALWLWWQFTGDSSPPFAYYDTAGRLFLLAFAVLETVLAFAAWRRFCLDQPFSLAWGVIALAGVSRVAGAFSAHVLPSEWLRRFGVSVLGPKSLREGGLSVAGPATHLFLLLALAVVLNLYRGLGWSARLKRRDCAVFAFFAVYTARHLYEVWVLHRDLASVLAFLNRVSDPLRLLLFIQAVLLWRSSQRMASGPVARCWACYSAAGALALAGDVRLRVSYWRLIPRALQQHHQVHLVSSRGGLRARPRLPV